LFNFRKFLSVLAMSTMLANILSTSVMAATAPAPTLGGSSGFTKSTWTDAQKADYLTDLNSKKTTHKTGKIDVSTAANADLEAFGLPDRPTDPDKLDMWNKVYGDVKEMGDATFQVGDQCHITWDTTGTSPLWTGGINYDTTMPQIGYQAGGYQESVLMAVTPKFNGAPPNNAYCNQWSGLGGTAATGNTDLVQNGVTESNWSTISEDDLAWFEDINNITGSKYLNAPCVNVGYNGNMYWIQGGDNVMTYTEILSPTIVEFYWDDKTTGVATLADITITESDGKTAYLSSNTAEWISESPNYALSPHNWLADYGTEDMSYCRYTYGVNHTAEYGMIDNPLATGHTETVAANDPKQSITQPDSNMDFYVNWLSN